MSFPFPDLKCCADIPPEVGESVFWVSGKYDPQVVLVISKAKRDGFFKIESSHGERVVNKKNLYHIKPSDTIDVGSRVLIEASVSHKEDGFFKVDIVDSVLFVRKSVWVLEADVVMTKESRLLREINQTRDDLKYIAKEKDDE